ncbi:MAG: Na+/H+ antiporter NhaC family protein, partial [Bacteroidota bacterium]
MSLGFISLLPAIVTVLVAFSTKKVHWAMGIGILSGAVVLGQGDFLGRFIHYLTLCFTDPVRLKIALFVLLVGGMLQVMAYTGASRKLGEFLAALVKTPARARMASFTLIASLFFDDYANAMIAGASMRPVMDRYRISPAFLAYMADVVAPLASIVLLSTWAAFEISLIEGAMQARSLTGSAMGLFFASIPFHFYTYLSIFFAGLAAATGKWFSSPLDDGSGIVAPPAEEGETKARKRDILAPLGTLLGVAIVGMFSIGALKTPPADRGDLSQILGNAPTIDVLILAVVLALFVMTILMLQGKVVQKKQLMSNFAKGVGVILSTALIILLAKGLEACTNDLGTGTYLTNLLGGYLSIRFVPLMIFLVATFVSVASGFNWSSMVLVMPVAVQMAQPGGPMVLAAAVGATIS